MASFAVDLVELDAVVAGLDDFTAAFDRRLADLRVAVALLHQDWLGAAADAQRVAHQRLASGADEMREALAALHAVARHAHASYSASADANRSTWRQLGPC